MRSPVEATTIRFAEDTDPSEDRKSDEIDAVFGEPLLPDLLDL